MAGFFSTIEKLLSVKKQNRNGPPEADYLALALVDAPVITLIRLLLGGSALIITLVDPASPSDRLAEIICLTLAVYCVYAGLLYIFALRGETLLPIHLPHWIDIGGVSDFSFFDAADEQHFLFSFIFSDSGCRLRLGL